MNKPNTFKRVIWAVDAFAEDTDLQRRTFEILKATLREADISIEPVSVIHWEDHYAINHPVKDLAAIAKSAEQSIEQMRSTFASGTLPPVILSQDNMSLGNAVRKVITFAQKSGADLITVGTKAKKGTTRFLLGSFAETLVLQSDVPVLIVNPDTKKWSVIDHILFPTDFSEEARVGFMRVLSLAAAIGARITLYHRNLHGDVTAKEKEAAPLLNAARDMGIDISFLIAEDGPSVATAILQFSAEMPSTIVAMVSKSGLLGAVILGKIARQVIRESLSPVWVLHPRLEHLNK